MSAATWAPGYILVSQELHDDLGIPLWAWVHRSLLYDLYAQQLGEATTDPIELLERGTADWDGPIFEDEDDWWGWWGDPA